MNKPTKILIGMPVPETINNKVLIAGPVANGWKQDVRRTVYPLGERNVSLAPSVYEISGDLAFGRNKIVMDLQDLPERKDVTHLFLVDDDTIPPPGTLSRLLGYKKDIIAPVYPMFHYPKALWSVALYDENKPIDCTSDLIEYQDLPDKLFRAHYVGGGALLVRREVFDKIEWPPFERTPDPRCTEYLSEDFTFCVKAKKAGYELWCDPIIKCLHRKFGDLLQIFDSCYKQFRS